MHREDSQEQKWPDAGEVVRLCAAELPHQSREEGSEHVSIPVGDQRLDRPDLWTARGEGRESLFSHQRCGWVRGERLVCWVVMDSTALIREWRWREV